MRLNIGPPSTRTSLINKSGYWQPALHSDQGLVHADSAANDLLQQPRASMWLVAECIQCIIDEFFPGPSRPNAEPLRGLILAKRCFARYIVDLPSRRQVGLNTSRRFATNLPPLFPPRNARERPRRSELAQFVTDHVFCHEHLHMLLSVVHH